MEQAKLISRMRVDGRVTLFHAMLIIQAGQLSRGSFRSVISQSLFGNEKQGTLESASRRGHLSIHLIGIPAKLCTDR